MPGPLSPLMMIAGSGILQNTGLDINQELQSNMTTYQSIGAVNEFNTALTSAAGVVSAGVLTSMKTFSAVNFPAVTNTVPDGKSGIGNAEDRFIDQLETHADNILGNGDLSKFAIHMSTVQGYVTSTNQLIDAANKNSEYLGPTFDSMDSLTTGGITSVNLYTEDFGTDLANTGRYINLKDIDMFGTPKYLIKVLYDRGLIKVIKDEMLHAGVNVEGLMYKIDTEGFDIAPVIQKKCYAAFKTVTNADLQIILDSLLIETVSGIETLADLLDLTKLFPNSYQGFTYYSNNILTNIYKDSTKAVNEVFAGSGKNLYSILPKSVADSNVTFIKSIKQIKNLENLTVSDLSTLALEIETNYGLNGINSLDKPVPDSVKSYFTSSFGNGSGPNGKYYLSDGIGTPAGIVHNDELETVIEQLSELTTNGNLDSLYKAGSDTGVFTVMIDVVNDVYGTGPIVIPGGYPAAGTHTDYDAAITALISSANSAISALPSTAVNICNDSFDAMADHILLELATLSDAGVTLASTPSSKTSAMSLVQNLHNYAKQNTLKGPAEILEKLADTSQAGEAIIASLREGRNSVKLQRLGIGADNLPDLPQSTETAELSTSKYSQGV